MYYEPLFREVANYTVSPPCSQDCCGLIFGSMHSWTALPSSLAEVRYKAVPWLVSSYHFASRLDAPSALHRHTLGARCLCWHHTIFTQHKLLITPILSHRASHRTCPSLTRSMCAWRVPTGVTYSSTSRSWSSLRHRTSTSLITSFR